MPTRIYQGRVTSIKFENRKDESNDAAYKALIHTFELFQDAVNYHIVAIAAMAVQNDDLHLSSFVRQVKGIWEPHLRESLSRCLGVNYYATFEEIADLIFKDCTRKDALPYIMQFLLTRGNGEGGISKDSKTIAPWLCFKDTKATFPMDAEWLKACKKRRMLKQLVGDNEIDEVKLRDFAKGMQLTWAGVKCQKGKEWDAATFREVLKESISSVELMKIPVGLEQIEFEERIRFWKANVHNINLTGVMKNVGGNFDMLKKAAAIVFIAFPDKVSAKILFTKLDDPEELLPGYPLEDDPFVLARGERGYVYKGVTALSNWEKCSKNWEILAFAEALKTLHSFILKTVDRDTKCKEIDDDIAYIETGKRNKSKLQEDDEDLLIPVLGGDPRFEALKKLVKEISTDEITEYHISSRTLKGFEQLRKAWLVLESAGKGDFNSLVKKVREHQASGVRFGSLQLYEALCQDEYRNIWHEWTDKKHPRSSNILRDFSEWQRLRAKKEQYERPVRVSAANPMTSPRQLMYSDLSKKDCKFIAGNSEKVQVSVVVRNARSCWEFVPAILEFSAPRFERDEMGRDTLAWVKKSKNEETPVSWIQPMMRAMDLPAHLVKLERTPAVALYVKYGHKEEAECPIAYLNLPVSLKVELLQRKVAKAKVWEKQFNGTSKEKLHLHWPSTYKNAAEPWWNNDSLAKDGFSVLGVDLGIRSAFAWSLIHVSKHETNLEPVGRLIGAIGDEKWYGFVRKQGITRINGERTRIVKNKEVPAVALPTKEDVELLNKIYKSAGADMPQVENKTLYDLVKLALLMFHRILSRTRKYQSFLSKLSNVEDIESSLAVIQKHFSYGGHENEVTQACNEKDVDQVKSLLFEKIVELRTNLPIVAVDVTNLLLPRKRGHWEWVGKSIVGWQGAGQMILFEEKDEKNDTSKRQVFHRGGISIERITQLETLRQRLQSMSKVLSCPIGEKVPFGRFLKEAKVLDPCPQVLEKLENMKEQRVNVIAHEIVAQALGVRLITSKNKQNQGGRDVWHGEYERIPNRAPVDFVVMENLKGYQTNIDRTPYENSTLMRWSHRQITAKVVQLLQEVFGIPVIFTHATYTSKFDCLHSSPGFRPELITEKNLRYMSQSADKKEVTLANVYQDLYQQLQKSSYRGKIALIKPHHKNGGEMFLSECCGKLILRNADVNAATNIAWRGIAAPEAIHLLHRVRMEKKKGGLTPRWKDEREKALKGKWSLNPHAELTSENNFISTFFASPDVEKLSFAIYGDEHTHVALSHGKVLWGNMEQRHWELCHRYNISLLLKAGIDTTPLEKLLFKDRKEKEQDADDIPM